MVSKNPVIIVLTYNRVNTVERLLRSLESAYYEEFDGQIKLIISIDFSGSNELLNTIEKFKWSHGEIEIIKHTKHLGLKSHLLSCGDLTSLYERIILLEDDLAVSPYFYKYAVNALNYYEESENIGGISLYNHSYNESAKLPFLKIHDESDIYFLQIAASWGQAWTKRQWTNFRTWYSKNQFIRNEDNLPEDVIAWPKTSWKKHFIKYLVETDKYFVYPRVSYTTNFGDAGAHHRGTNVFQVPLSLSRNDFHFKKLSESLSVYDSHCELLPSIYKKLNSDLQNYNFESDLYGVKKIAKIKSEYILTSRKSKFGKTIKSFDILMKPMELNIKYNIQGDFIHLVELNKNDKLILTRSQKLKFYEYFYKSINKSLWKLFLQKVLIEKLNFNQNKK